MKSILIILFVTAITVTGCRDEKITDRLANAKIRLSADNSFLYIDNVDTVKYHEGDSLTLVYDFDATVFETGWKISRLPYPDTTCEIKNREMMFRRGVIQEFR